MNAVVISLLGNSDKMNVTLLHVFFTKIDKVVDPKYKLRLFFAGDVEESVTTELIRSGYMLNKQYGHICLSIFRKWSFR